MMEEHPRYIENRQFVGFEEEDIQKVNQGEQRKFDENTKITEIMRTIEQKAPNGHWEEHWLTIDPSGKRVYARIYYSDQHAFALTADGQIVREMNYPAEDYELNDNIHTDDNVTLH